MYFSWQRTPPGVATVLVFFSLQKPFLSQRQRKQNLWFWKKTNSAHSSMHVYKHIYVHCYLFLFDCPCVNIVLFTVRTPFKQKKNCFFYEGKKIECSLTYTYIYKYMYVYLYIYIHTHMNIYHVDLLLVGYYATLRAW